MDFQKVVKVVINSQDGILVTGQVTTEALVVPGAPVYSPTLQVVALHAGLTVVTGVGFDWKREGMEGQNFMPLFQELRAGECMEINPQTYVDVHEHFQYAAARLYRAEAGSLLVRAITPHGPALLSLDVTLIRTPFEGERLFRLPDALKVVPVP